VSKVKDDTGKKCPNCGAQAIADVGWRCWGCGFEWGFEVDEILGEGT